MLIGPVIQAGLRKHAARLRSVFEIGSTIAMIALAAVIVWEGRAWVAGSPATGAAPSLSIPAEPIPIGGSAMRGVRSAPVAIIEYSDFECSFCARFAQQVEPVLRREYIESGRVLFVFKHFPLPIHRQADAAARAAWCADRQGKFWEMHDRLFGFSNKLQGFDSQAAAKEMGLDPDLYKSCVASDEAGQRIQTDKAEAENLKVTGTPVFFIGKLTSDHRLQVSDVLPGAKPVEDFKVILDRLLGK